MTYVLSESAEQDIVKLYRSGVELFGPAQAESYLIAVLDQLDLIFREPLLFAEKHELEPVPRVCFYESHVILYRVLEDGEVRIERVRHQRENWLTADS